MVKKAKAAVKSALESEDVAKRNVADGFKRSTELQERMQTLLAYASTSVMVVA